MGACSETTVGTGQSGSLQCPAQEGPSQPEEIGVMDALALASPRRSPAAQATGHSQCLTACVKTWLLDFLSSHCYIIVRLVSAAQGVAFLLKY